MSVGVIAYMTIVALIGLAAVVKASTWLRLVLRSQKAQLKSRYVEEAVPTETPLRNPSQTARVRGLESIEAQFTVTRRILLPTIGVVAMLALSVPLWPQIPAATVSLLVATIAVLGGIAARPYLENALAGLTVSTSNLFNIGDTVLFDQQYGTIEDITSTHTTIKLWDWRRYIVPNSQMLSAKVISYTLHDPYRWTHVEFWVSYDADLDRVKEIALAAPLGCEHYAPHEAPVFWIMELARDAVQCWAAAWADSPSDSWMLGVHMRTEIILGLRQHGIRAHGFHHHVGHLPPVLTTTEPDGESESDRESERPT
jgi:small-conductance mechanosensitive channel